MLVKVKFNVWNHFNLTFYINSSMFPGFNSWNIISIETTALFNLFGPNLGTWPKIVSFRLPTHGRDAYRKFF